jgi:hypothetical protein
MLYNIRSSDRYSKQKEEEEKERYPEISLQVCSVQSWRK